MKTTKAKKTRGAVAVAPVGPTRVQRKARSSSDAGGVLIGGAHDPAEKDADRMAERVLAGGTLAGGLTPVAGVQRKCAECEAEEKANRSAEGGGIIAPGVQAEKAGAEASQALRGMGAGRPLDPASRAFFEPRFGADLSGVRVHDGAAADTAARSIGARAFAWGNDVAFASGERDRGGAHLMAHELAHVVQGKGAAGRQVKRATMATSDGTGSYKKVPTDQRSEVQAALDLIEKSIKAKKCADFFKDNCTGGTGTSAKDTFSASTVYFLDDHSERFGLSDIRKVAADKHVVAYNKYAYDIGRWEIASTLLHEMFHTCDMVVDNLDEVLAETATEECAFYSPWILEAGPLGLDVGDTMTLRGFQFGLTQDADHYVEMGGVKITSYSKWDFDRSSSNVHVAFVVPQAVNTNSFFSEDVAMYVVSHGHKSNVKTVNVDPW